MAVILVRESRSGITLSENFWPVGDRVMAVESGSLTTHFSLEDISRTLGDINASSAPNPDRLLVSIVQHFWPHLQSANMPMLQ